MPLACRNAACWHGPAREGAVKTSALLRWLPHAGDGCTRLPRWLMRPRQQVGASGRAAVADSVSSRRFASWRP